MKRLAIATLLLGLLTCSLLVLRQTAASPGSTERVSLDGAGAEANNGSGSGAITPDGRTIAFASAATNLVPGDNNGATDVFIRDRLAGTVERVSVNGAGNEANDWSGGHIGVSGDGRFVAFESGATNLVAGDTNNFVDVFVRDRATGSTERVSVSSSGAQPGEH